MSLRQASFATIADRLRSAADEFERWATIADALDDTEPAHKPVIHVKGVRRPVEETVIGRDCADYARLTTARVHGIQAVLRAEAGTKQVKHCAAALDHA